MQKSVKRRQFLTSATTTITTTTTTAVIYIFIFSTGYNLVSEPSQAGKRESMYPDSTVSLSHSEHCSE